MKKNIFNLQVGESLDLETATYLRVPSGWIVSQNFGSDTTSVFVPLATEQQSKISLEIPVVKVEE